MTQHETPLSPPPQPPSNPDSAPPGSRSEDAAREGALPHPHLDERWRKRFMVERQGQTFVLYAGLLDLGHQKGLQEISTTIVQIPSELNAMTAIVHATVVTEQGTFQGLGDASPGNVSRMMAPHLIRMAECVPVRAEILTRNGWRHHGDVRVGDEVLAYNYQDDRCEWLPLLAITVYTEVDDPLVHLSSRSFRATVTPDHTWAVANGMFTGLRKTSELRRGDRIFVAARAESGEHEMPPRDAAILGWALTDGTIRSDRGYPRMHIDQSKPDYVAEIRELLGPDATESVTPAGERTFPTGKTYATRPGHRFSLNAKLTRRLLASQPITDFIRLALPSLITRLSRESRAAMLDAMLKADGSGRDGRRWVFGKKRKPGVMEAFEILATLEGRALGVPRMSTGDVIPVRSVREDRMVATGYLKRTEAAPEPVWCPTTFWGTWVMRLDGMITITGNTRAKARALRDATNVGVTAFEEIGESPDRQDGDREALAAAHEPAWRSPGGGSASPASPRRVPLRSAEPPLAGEAKPEQRAAITRLLTELGQPPDEGLPHLSAADAGRRIMELQEQLRQARAGGKAS